MLLELLRHQWLSFWRGRGSGKSLALQIVIGLFILYMLASATFLGIALASLMEKLAPDQPPVQVFAHLLFYYFLIDVFFRYMMQELPTLTVEPYLALPIRKKQLLRFLHLRSLFHFLNFLPILLFLPFLFITVAPQYGTALAWSLLLCILGWMLFNHFLVLYVKRKAIQSAAWMIGFFVLVGFVGLADYMGWLSLNDLAANAMDALIASPWLCVLFPLLALLAFLNHRSYLLSHLYLEEIRKKKRASAGSDYSWLDRFGEVGELIALDIKLIIRNKRPRSVTILAAILLFYGFIFYQNEKLSSNSLGMLLFGAIFITGSFIINYGNFLFAWQSSHFDGIMASPVNARQYIKSKFVLFTMASTLALLITSLYGLMSYKLLLIQIAAYFFNLGVITVLTVALATRNNKGLDLSKSASFNYQGTGAVQWLYALIILLLPFLIYWPVSKIAGNWTGIAAVGLIGFVSLLAREWWINLLTKEFLKRKYSILEGFREK